MTGIGGRPDSDGQLDVKFVDPPGNRFGPCNARATCGHTACITLRLIALSLCDHCEQPIGYGRTFMTIKDGHGLGKHGVIHTTCLS